MDGNGTNRVIEFGPVEKKYRSHDDNSGHGAGEGAASRFRARDPQVQEPLMG